jgi:hypothetical protein
LELLNLLNSKIVEESHVAQYKKEMEKLQEQNSQLKTVNSELLRELKIEKKLRKVWNKEDPVLFEDIEIVKKELQEMKQRYANCK